MAEATIYKKLRPIKLAFIISPNDSKSVKDAIVLNSYLWGGKYNPIIPYYKRTPKFFKETSYPKKFKNIVNGYLKNFDPDFIIPMGNVVNDFDSKKDNRIISLNDVTNGIYEEYYAKYGISLFEILNYFYEKELKFVRKYPINIFYPIISKKNNLFLSSIFGNYDTTVFQQLSDNYFEPLNISTKNINLKNYLSFHSKQQVPLLSLMNYTIENLKREPFTFFTIFIMDASSNLDIIDFINLRATGIKVFPIAVQVLDNPEIYNFIINIINRYFKKTEKHSHITLLKSRSIGSKILSTFISNINNTLNEYDIKKKFVTQNWYPRMWEDFGRNADHIKPGIIRVSEESEQVNNIEEYFDTSNLSPSFKLDMSGAPRYANELSVRVNFGNEQTFAEILPEGDSFFAQSIGFIGFRDWRISNSGLVHFSNFNKESITLKYPLSERVMQSWLKLNNWEVQQSSAGLIAKEMLNQLKGAWNISLIAKEGMINLFEEMGNGKSLNHKYFIGEINKIIKKDKNDKSNYYLKQLIDAKIFKLGLCIQCKICNQNSWFSITELDYDLTCPKCLNSYAIPSESVSLLKWSFRLIGPFSLPKRSHGIYTVLLSLRFFSLVLDGLTTPIFSFNASYLKKQIEVDLALFFQKDRFDSKERELVFIECKTFNEIDRKDISRMKIIMDSFPSCIIVFATLNKKLSLKEQKLIIPLANKTRRNLMNSKPSHHIIILTARELYSDFRLHDTYEELGEEYKRQIHRMMYGNNVLEELSDLTQQLYLNMESWDKYIERRLKFKTHNQPLKPTASLNSARADKK